MFDNFTQGKSIINKSVLIVLCIFLLMVIVQGVQAAETYEFVTKWGSYGSGNGQFNGPSGVAIDSSGNVYVIDYQNDRIEKFSSTAVLHKFARLQQANNYPEIIQIKK